MTSQALVRPAHVDDFVQWCPLWENYNAFYGRKGTHALADAITRKTWERFHDTAEPVHCIVAEHKGRLIGLAHFIFHRNTILLEPTCYMQDLYTDTAARGTGVGKALINAVYEHAATQGTNSVYWHTHHTNAAARKLYDKVADDSQFVVYRKRQT